MSNLAPSPASCSQLHRRKPHPSLKREESALLRRCIDWSYRDIFWRMAWPALKQADIDEVIHISLVAHHMISYAREAQAGFQTAAFYSPKLQQSA